MPRKGQKIYEPVKCPKCGKPTHTWTRINYTYGCGCLNTKCRIEPVFGNTRVEVINEWNRLYGNG